MRAFLIIVIVAIASGTCFRAVAETVLVAPGDSQISPADESRLDEEANRRAEGLKSDGFGEAQRVSTNGPIYFALWVGQASDENAISLWFETGHGALAIKLWNPQGDGVVSWQERRGERLEQVLNPGTYLVAVRGIGGARAHGVIGVKGPKTEVSYCPIEFDALHGKLTEHRADSRHGYSWPYLLFTPAQRAVGPSKRPSGGTFLVAPNSNGAALGEDVEFLRAGAICSLESNINALDLANTLGTPLLVPMFPRPRRGTIDLQLQALTRASLKEKEPKLARVDLQLIAMIKAARKELVKRRPVRVRVLMAGFSAAGSFTNRFTVLHPRRVLAAAVGAPGWPIAPVGVYRGVNLPYPVGIADVEELTGQPVDLKALSRVRILFFLGAVDTNDPVPCRDSFSATDEKLINRWFGKAGLECAKDAGTLVERWRAAKRLYRTAGLTLAKFKPPYPGVRHDVTDDMRKEILATFRTALGAR